MSQLSLGQALPQQQGIPALPVERRAIKVRLAEIDTPEKGQPYGSAARQALSSLVFGKHATVRQQARDRYGRTVGRVYVDGLDVNAELVRSGHAWVYRKYATDRSLYALEAEAKAAQRGLWALPEAQRAPPWEWRHGGRKRAQAAPACGPKRYCREMASCEEARYYRSVCGLTRLRSVRGTMPMKGRMIRAPKGG